VATQPPAQPAEAPSDEQRYGWPGADAGDLASRAASIARHLVHTRLRTIGLLPAPGAGDGRAPLSPLLAALGEAVLGFVAEEVAVIDTWPTWAWATAAHAGDTAAYRARPLRERLVELAPLPCADPEAATLALGMAVEALPPRVRLTLVNLAGYAAPGLAPAAIDVLDGAVLVAAAGRTQSDSLVRLAALVSAKNLGTILVD
jgi:hypothetical protein